jgi:mannose-6-phosphate isomerase class I
MEINIYDGNVTIYSLIKGNIAESKVVLKPGDYDLGRATNNSVITITKGEITINGNNLKEGQKIEINKGQNIIVQTKNNSAYLIKTDKYRC